MTTDNALERAVVQCGEQSCERRSGQPLHRIVRLLEETTWQFTTSAGSVVE
jgi:hypothetical protein